MSFECVHLGKAVSDIRLLKDEYFDGNNLFAKRVLGNPQPENKVLGALVLDESQTEFLWGSLEFLEKNAEFDSNQKTTFQNILNAVQQLSTILSEARCES